MKKRISYFIYLLLFLGILMVPSAGMLVAPTGNTSSENRTLAKLPSWKNEDGGIQWDYLSLMGDYFQDHFGFRSYLVTGNALLSDRVGQISASSSVIRGTDGWLYYKDSLDDFQGTNLLPERALFDIAHSLSMVQAALKMQDIAFAFGIAPNKNSLYPEHMPYYYQVKASAENNYHRLEPLLEQEGVNVVNLHEILGSMDEVLYHQRDSHWNNKGAAIAADSWMRKLRKNHKSYADADHEVRCDFIGDLDAMLFPEYPTAEEEIYYIPEPEFLYVDEVESNFDPRIQTQSLADGNLVMYRDSFANTLLPFFAESYGNAFFSRGVPYTITGDVSVYHPDTIVIERAERFLPDMAANPPVMAAIGVRPSGNELPLEAKMYTVTAEAFGQFAKISGTIDDSVLETDSRILVRLGEKMFEAFPYHEQGTERYVLYLPGLKVTEQNAAKICEDITVMVLQKNSIAG